ncbi:mannosyltransferase family protein [Aestuariimicrobium soli]|uniref:mannosyltransferase family protein n=1 Tax=Aestuariimicrobium soli TaxID=2035834 RepID=UPI003EBADE43
MTAATNHGADRAATRGRGAARSLAERRLLAQVWAASRLFLLVVLLVVITQEPRRFRDALGNWDVQHYLTVARDGYADPKEMAFFPGLPAVLRLFEAVHVPMWLTGAVLAIVCSALAAGALYRIAGPASSSSTGPGGLVAAGLWLVAPTAVFTTVAYTEAPFCAAAFWAWERARRGRWAEAALLATVACSFRVSGLFLVGALLVLALVGDGPHSAPHAGRSSGRRGGRGRVGTGLPPLTVRLRHAAWLLVPAAALLAWTWYLHGLTGSWTAWFDAQKEGWGRGLHTPRESWEATWRAAQPSSWPDRPRVAWVFTAEIVSMAVGLATTVICLLRRRWASASWVAVMLVAFGTSVWWMSISRAALLWFPTFVLVGEFAAWATRGRATSGRSASSRSSWFRAAGQVLVALLFAACLVANAVWAWLFFRGDWAG